MPQQQIKRSDGSLERHCFMDNNIVSIHKYAIGGSAPLRVRHIERWLEEFVPTIMMILLVWGVQHASEQVKRWQKVQVMWGEPSPHRIGHCPLYHQAHSYSLNMGWIWTLNNVLTRSFNNVSDRFKRLRCYGTMSEQPIKHIVACDIRLPLDLQE